MCTGSELEKHGRPLDRHVPHHGPDLILDRRRWLTLDEGFFATLPELRARSMSNLPDLPRDLLLLAPRGESAYLAAVIGE